MKYKNLTKEQLIISFDRLTRFKNTKDKYFRVFSDIILSNLIEPVYKKSELIDMSAHQITEIAENIINNSLAEEASPTLTLPLSKEGINEQCPLSESGSGEGKINSILKNYENFVFNNDEETQEFLNNKINYDLFLPLIDESCPINLRWLKKLSNCEDLKKLRHDNGLKFPIQKVLLVEGITEEILLPAFSKYLGFDFYKEGIQIIPAGGKNQVVKLYYKMAEELRIPIFLLLDNDAKENINQIMPRLRKIDIIHLVSCGEFEDLLPKSLIIKTINNELSNFASVSDVDLNEGVKTVVNLENIFKTKGLHEFKKSDFAKMVRDNISEDSDISAEIASIIMEIGL